MTGWLDDIFEIKKIILINTEKFASIRQESFRNVVSDLSKCLEEIKRKVWKGKGVVTVDEDSLNVSFSINDILIFVIPEYGPDGVLAGYFVTTEKTDNTRWLHHSGKDLNELKKVLKEAIAGVL